MLAKRFSSAERLRIRGNEPIMTELLCIGVALAFIERIAIFIYIAYLSDLPRPKIGILFRWGSFWIGGHWSSYNRRLCVNLIPCVTVWIALPGGNVPNNAHEIR